MTMEEIIKRMIKNIVKERKEEKDKWRKVIEEKLEKMRKEREGITVREKARDMRMDVHEKEWWIDRGGNRQRKRIREQMKLEERGEKEEKEFARKVEGGER